MSRIEKSLEEFRKLSFFGKIKALIKQRIRYIKVKKETHEMYKKAQEEFDKKQQEKAK